MPQMTLLAALATLSTLREVHTAPKPGLVDRLNSGAHKDMDFSTFVKSAIAIAPGWKEQARLGLDGIQPGEALPGLRAEGLRMERAMARATDGVNTHKGLIFALSLLVYAAGFTAGRGSRLDAGKLCGVAGKVLDDCIERELYALRDNPPDRPLTHGERLFLLHGVTGIRGEAQKGFPSLLNEGLPALLRCLKSGLPLEDAALEALLALMGTCEDSNVIHRKSYDYWKGPYLRLVRDLRTGTLPGSKERREGLVLMDRHFSRERVSPGGAADLLTCTFFLYFCSDLFDLPKNILETWSF